MYKTTLRLKSGEVYEWIAHDLPDKDIYIKLKELGYPREKISIFWTSEDTCKIYGVSSEQLEKKLLLAGYYPEVGEVKIFVLPESTEPKERALSFLKAVKDKEGAFYVLNPKKLKEFNEKGEDFLTDLIKWFLDEDGVVIFTNIHSSGYRFMNAGGSKVVELSYNYFWEAMPKFIMVITREGLTSSDNVVVCEIKPLEDYMNISTYKKELQHLVSDLSSLFIPTVSEE